MLRDRLLRVASGNVCDGWFNLRPLNTQQVSTGAQPHPESNQILSREAAETSCHPPTAPQIQIINHMIIPNMKGDAQPNA